MRLVGPIAARNALVVLVLLLSSAPLLGCGRVAPGGGDRPEPVVSSGGPSAPSGPNNYSSTPTPAPTNTNSSNVYDTSCGKAYGESGLANRYSQGCR